jgi:anti-sigma factor RsiW
VHVDPDLSANLDGELAPDDRARVETHLASCERCGRRLAELRSTASLISALPYSRAPRSLVPSVAQRWNWLRPVRSLSAFASGAFLFVFLLTAVARTGAGLGGGATTAGAPAAAPQASFGLAVPAPTSVPAPAFDTTQRSSASAAPSPAVPPAVAAPQKATEVASPSVEGAQRSDVARSFAAVRSTEERPVNPLAEPLFWLGLAVLAAVLAIAAHTRLRTA